MSKKRYEIVSYDIPLWLKPVLSVTETSIYTGIRSLLIERLGGSVRIAAESGTALSLPVPVGVNARIAVGTYF